MKTITLCVLALSVLGFFGVALAETPHEVAGIRLGEGIKKYESVVDMKTSAPVWQQEYLSQVEARPIEGYRSVYVTYGTCDPNQPVLRIKLKYQRDDSEFFDELLKRFKKKFGEPSEYKGDVFRAFIAWKWAFTDKGNNKISMILQRNNEDDEDFTSGNSLKMAITNLIQEERQCYTTRHPEPQTNEQSVDETSRKIDIEQLIPK